MERQTYPLELVEEFLQAYSADIEIDLREVLGALEKGVITSKKDLVRSEVLERELGCAYQEFVVFAASRHVANP